MNDADRQRLASLLFPKRTVSIGGGASSSGAGLRLVEAASDSAGGMVSVIIGAPEYDEFGNEIVSIADVTVSVPIICTASAGDDVLIAIIDGSPVAIGVPGLVAPSASPLRAFARGADTSGTTPTTGTYKAQVTLNATYSELDGGFTISGGGIKCPKAGRVRIDASVLYNSTAGRNRGCYIHKGSTEVMGTYAYSAEPNVAGFECDVAADDVLYLYARGTTTSETYYNGRAATYLRVEYI